MISSSLSLIHRAQRTPIAYIYAVPCMLIPHPLPVQPSFFITRDASLFVVIHSFTTFYHLNMYAFQLISLFLLCSGSSMARMVERRSSDSLEVRGAPFP